MKLITTILLAILMLSCSAQEPDVECFSTGKMDSVIAIVQIQQIVIDSLASQNIGLQESIAWWKTAYASLAQSINYFEPVADTFHYTIRGLTDSLIIKIDKYGTRANTVITNGEKRVTVDYHNGERTVWFMDDNRVTADSVSSRSVGLLVN